MSSGFCDAARVAAGIVSNITSDTAIIAMTIPDQSNLYLLLLGLEPISFAFI
ncbi:hypothetical protein LRHMDP2_2853 [Lacticaseibacillus rhamnosus LRHMDP2]|nr:hypothetical protein LRHMDP2_2853 [Lacticaseibacillus rhamnosus LRHMDP2]